MREDIRFGRIAGITVGANWSLVLVVALITWIVATGVLPAGEVDHPAVVYWAVAAGTAVAFLASLLAHEMAHALVARSRGMPVDGITLWMFGGVSRLRGDAPDARSELRMAAAGPLTSLAIGVAAVGAAAVLVSVGAPWVAVDAVAWLGVMNVALAVFNMLPAFPLDGGRVLRAALWLRRGDERRATEVASQAGVVFAYLLMALGVAGFVAGTGISGIWMVFLGWVLLGAARAERAHFELRFRLGDARVSEVMTAHPDTVPAGLTVDGLVRGQLAQHRHSAFPVVRPDGSPAGLVTLDRVGALASASRATTPVGRIARPVAEVVTTRPDEPVVELVERFQPGSGRRALVIDEDGRLVGIVTSSDVERALAVGRSQARRTARRRPTAPVP